MKVKAVVDRIEGNLAILELAGKSEIIWPVTLLPKNIKSGSIIDIVITENIIAEKKQRDKIAKMQKRLAK